MTEESNKNMGLVSGLGDWIDDDVTGRERKYRIRRGLFVWYFGNVDFEETGIPTGFTQHSYILA